LPGSTAFYYFIDLFPSAAQFFEISQSSFHGFISGLISLIVWLFIILLGAGIYLSVVDTINEKIEDLTKYRGLSKAERTRRRLGYDKDKKP